MYIDLRGRRDERRSGLRSFRSRASPRRRDASTSGCGRLPTTSTARNVISKRNLRVSSSDTGRRSSTSSTASRPKRPSWAPPRTSSARRHAAPRGARACSHRGCDGGARRAGGADYRATPLNRRDHRAPSRPRDRDRGRDRTGHNRPTSIPVRWAIRRRTRVAQADLLDVTNGPLGLLAVGYLARDFTADAWASADGLTWVRSTGFPSADSSMAAAIAEGAGASLAVGSSSRPPRPARADVDGDRRPLVPSRAPDPDERRAAGR